MMKITKLGITFLLVSLLWGCQNHIEPMSSTSVFDWQGHRGARGLMPENSIPAFLKALEYPAIQTLELDLAVSKDLQLIVSHEPWLSPNICLNPSGDSLSINPEDEVLIFRLTASAIKDYDCGSLTPKEFPNQQSVSVVKPTLEEVINAVSAYCTEQNRPFPNFNMEIKSQPNWDEIYTPAIGDFVNLVVKSLDRFGIRAVTNIQSFDVRPLQILHELDPTIPLSYLIYEKKSLSEHIEDLGFTPRIISPHYKILDEDFISQAKDAGMKMVPWTVNEIEDMENLIAMGIDGIITDYPNKIPK